MYYGITIRKRKEKWSIRFYIDHTSNNMKTISYKVKELGINTALQYLEKDPEKNLGKLMDWVDRFAGDSFDVQRGYIRKYIVDDPESN